MTARYFPSSDHPNRIGRALRHLRHTRRETRRDVATQLLCDHATIVAVETGRWWPERRDWVEDADVALNADGALVAAWDADQAESAQAADTLRVLDEARRDSRTQLLAPDGASLDEIANQIAGMATTARMQPYDTALTKAQGLRAELARRLAVGAHSPDSVRDLYLALGRVCGILAYLTLDLGQPDHAKAHAESAFLLGDRAGDNQLRAWSRGTQALAFRFTRDFQAARAAAEDGLKYVSGSTGTTEPRLLCALAASVANLGDTTRAVELLERADHIRDKCRPDQMPGLFTFSTAKQIYYHGFSLMWADDTRILNRSIRSSQAALRAWSTQRSPGDETLTTIYLAMAHTRGGDLDAALTAVTPILAQPIEAHFSWVRQRLNQFDRLLAQHFPDSSTALAQREALRAYVHSV